MPGPTQRPSSRKQLEDIPFFPSVMDQPLPRGPHICQIYTSSEERRNAVCEFIRNALETGEQTFCISERPTDDILGEYLAGTGISLDRASQSGQYHACDNHDFYLRDGVFDPQYLVARWGSFLHAARDQGSPALWAVADVLPELGCLHGGTQLIIYESKLEGWLQSNRATILCQDDARAFDACGIMNVLRVHPLVLANGRVADCPFFTWPDRRSH